MVGGMEKGKEGGENNFFFFSELALVKGSFDSCVSQLI